MWFNHATKPNSTAISVIAMSIVRRLKWTFSLFWRSVGGGDLIAAVFMLSAAVPQPAQQRIVAIGDLHGDFDAWRAIAAASGIGVATWIFIVSAGRHQSENQQRGDRCFPSFHIRPFQRLYTHRRTFPVRQCLTPPSDESLDRPTSNASSICWKAWMLKSAANSPMRHDWEGMIDARPDPDRSDRTAQRPGLC